MISTEERHAEVARAFRGLVETVRDRDSRGQVRVPIAELEDVFAKRLGGTPWRVVAERYPAQPAAGG